MIPSLFPAEGVRVHGEEACLGVPLACVGEKGPECWGHSSILLCQTRERQLQQSAQPALALELNLGPSPDCPLLAIMIVCVCVCVCACMTLTLLEPLFSHL